MTARQSEARRGWSRKAHQSCTFYLREVSRARTELGEQIKRPSCWQTTSPVAVCFSRSHKTPPRVASRVDTIVLPAEHVTTETTHLSMCRLHLFQMLASRVNDRLVIAIPVLVDDQLLA